MNPYLNHLAEVLVSSSHNEYFDVDRTKKYWKKIIKSEIFFLHQCLPVTRIDLELRDCIRASYCEQFQYICLSKYMFITLYH